MIYVTKLSYCVKRQGSVFLLFASVTLKNKWIGLEQKLASVLYTNFLAVVYVTRKFDTSYTSKLVGIKNESKFVWVLHSHIHDIWHCLKVRVIQGTERTEFEDGSWVGQKILVRVHTIPNINACINPRGTIGQVPSEPIQCAILLLVPRIQINCSFYYILY